MKSIYVLCFLLLVVLSSCLARDLLVGTNINAQLVYHTKVFIKPIPFKKRIKEVFYSDPGQRMIRGIIAKDIGNTDSSAVVTAGGVGYSYANIKLSGAHSSGLNYLIDFFV